MAPQIWCRTTSARAQFYEKTLEMVNLVDDPECPRAGRHRELEKAEVKKGKDAVQRVMSAVKGILQFTPYLQEQVSGIYYLQ